LAHSLRWFSHSVNHLDYHQWQIVNRKSQNLFASHNCCLMDGWIGLDCFGLEQKRQIRFRYGRNQLKEIN